MHVPITFIYTIHSAQAGEGFLSIYRIPSKRQMRELSVHYKPKAIRYFIVNTVNYRIAGKFHGVLNFVIFVVHYEVTKISTHDFFQSYTHYAHAWPP